MLLKNHETFLRLNDFEESWFERFTQDTLHEDVERLHFGMSFQTEKNMTLWSLSFDALTWSVRATPTFRRDSKAGIFLWLERFRCDLQLRRHQQECRCSEVAGSPTNLCTANKTLILMPWSSMWQLSYSKQEMNLPWRGTCEQSCHRCAWSGRTSEWVCQHRSSKWWTYPVATALSSPSRNRRAKRKKQKHSKQRWPITLSADQSSGDVRCTCEGSCRLSRLRRWEVERSVLGEVRLVEMASKMSRCSTAADACCQTCLTNRHYLNATKQLNVLHTSCS